MRGNMKGMVANAPDAAKPHLQWITDQMASDPGTGRHADETLETAADARAQVWSGQIKNLLDNHDLNRRTEAQRENLRDQVISEKTPPLTSEIGKVAAGFRRISNEIWYALNEAGVVTQYWGRNGHLSREFNDHAILSAKGQPHFLVQAAKVPALQFNEDVAGSTTSDASTADAGKLLTKVKEIGTSPSSTR